ncbi:MAG: energy transducer TonB [Bacteroidales bacterium]|nr:energy transducer TonB [Bacteroidales bacterium]MDE6256974.1 energy transducer TonB [Muribaculaceae bacterium]
MAKNVDLTSQEWRDLIFEGKNHDFGAYQLRKKSDRRHNLAVAYTLIGLVILFIGIFAWSKFSDYRAEQRALELAAEREKMMQAAIAEQKEAEEEQQEEEQEEQRYEEPEPDVKQVPEEVLNTIQQTQIDIVDKVVNEVVDQEEIKQSEAFAGAITQEGSGDADKAKAFQEAVVTAPVEAPKPVVEEKKEDNKIFEAVEQPAEFPGGMAKLMSWLSSNIRYPEAAAQNDIQGRVIVKFVVEKDGSIGNVTVVKGVDKDLDREAIRVVKKMPKWQPGKNNGVSVRSYFNLPVTFKLAQQ